MPRLHDTRPAEVICSADENLRVHPLLGQRVHGDIRELAISFGQTGYIAPQRFVVPRDEAWVPAIRHQRELGCVP